jgi:hypothetical protein
MKVGSERHRVERIAAEAYAGDRSLADAARRRIRFREHERAGVERMIAEQGNGIDPIPVTLRRGICARCDDRPITPYGLSSERKAARGDFDQRSCK